MRVGIVAQRENARARALAAELDDQLAQRGESVVLDRATAAALGLDEPTPEADAFPDCDLVVSIGGDGTFLYAASAAGTTPVLGVNLGEVGFLNAVAPADATDAVGELVDRYAETGSVPSRPVQRLEARIRDAATGPDRDPGTDGEDWPVGPALNEVLVQAPTRGRGGGLSLEVRVDGTLFSSTRADGLLVSTPTGSTAYNLSEGGPLVHPDATGIIVNGMSPAEPMPPVVVGPDSEIAVRAADAEAVVVAVDGGEARRLPAPQLVEVRRTGSPARLAGPRAEFFQALTKLE